MVPRMRLLPFFVLLGGCFFGNKDIEGDEPGECTDGADNDRDGDFDCDDDDCEDGPDCEEEGDADVDVDVDADADADVDTDTDTYLGQPCSLVGEWLLTNVKCSSFDIAEWYEVYDETRMDITGDGTGGCIVEFGWTGAGCRETEQWTLQEVAGSDVDITFGGIDSCVPTACLFPNDVDACALGDRSGGPMTFTFDTANPNQILTAGLLGDAWPQCTLDLVTTWTLQ